MAARRRTKRVTSAQTRTQSVRAPIRRGRLLETGAVVISPETGLRFRVAELLGEGGFGQVYLAARIGAAGRDAGLKLMEVKRLREKGHKIKLLAEKQFWHLIG